MRHEELNRLVPSRRTLRLQDQLSCLPCVPGPTQLQLKLRSFIDAKSAYSESGQFGIDSLPDLLAILGSSHHSKLSAQIITPLDSWELQQISRGRLFAAIIQKSSQIQNSKPLRQLFDRLDQYNLLDAAYTSYIINHLSQQSLVDFSRIVRGASMCALLEQLRERAVPRSSDGVDQENFENFFQSFLSLQGFQARVGANDFAIQFTYKLYFSLFPDLEQRKKLFDWFLTQHNPPFYDQITFLNQVYPYSGVPESNHLRAELRPLIQLVLSRLSTEELPTSIKALIQDIDKRTKEGQKWAIHGLLFQLLRENPDRLKGSLTSEQCDTIARLASAEASLTQAISEQAGTKPEIQHRELARSKAALLATAQKSSLFAITISAKQPKPAAAPSNEASIQRSHSFAA